MAVMVGAEAADVRRSVGPAAWCALEVLAASPLAEDGDTWIVRSSVRELASQMGIAKITAQRALCVLRHAELIEFVQRRSAVGRFGSCAYRLDVSADVLHHRPRRPSMESSSAVSAVGVPRKAPVPAKAPAVSGQQLVLLPLV